MTEINHGMSEAELKKLALQEKMKSFYLEKAADIFEDARSSGVSDEKIDQALKIAAAFSVNPPDSGPTTKILAHNALSTPDSMNPQNYSKEALTEDPQMLDLLHKLQVRGHELSKVDVKSKDEVHDAAGFVSSQVTKRLEDLE